MELGATKLRLGGINNLLNGCALQTYMVRSKLDCVRRCFSLTSCVWLTYTTLARDRGSCVCLASCMTNNKAITTPATVYFNSCSLVSDSAWLNRSCDSNGDCPADNSECYNQSSTCVCTPGYYYSVNFDTCVRDCDPRNLRNTFVKYTNGCLAGNDLRETSGITLQQCEEMCVKDTRCLTFDYPPDFDTCYLSDQTALTVNSFSPICNGYTGDHYQRMCF
ncbi:uncharacterized protein LOC112566071 isoform X2 [Pomacea canaliculata]|uniref:uncharacterized protein LOC112566071 isoform X2 n=1 Tax=Pomacea canaliculata TaxID=400727 RepID=UPI000D733B7C|nr:uncharacterized protein LOC112566071 isoform X2 [Pomacea canaliculata]